MIVNQLNDAWEIVSHRAHAFLAMQIIERWRFDQAPPWFYDLVAAVLHHDDMTNEFSCAPVSGLGLPLDFTLQRDFDRVALSALVDSALLRSQWTGLLVSKHLFFLNEPRINQDSEIRAFITEQVALQEKTCLTLKITLDDADAAYSLMRFADRMSLILAQRAIPDRERSLEICAVGVDTTYFLREVSDEYITVEPWPFRVAEFSLKLEVRLLRSSVYATPEDLPIALRATEPIIRMWHIKK